MAGKRGRSLDAEITRNVKAQKAADRAESKVRNRQFKSEQSRAKKLRSVHVPAIAKAKGLSRAQVESALQAQSPSTQIKALKNWVKANRKNGSAKAEGLNPKAARVAQRRQIEASRASATASARSNYTGVTPAQQVKLIKEARQQRAIADSLGKQLQASKPVPTILGTGSRLTGESMGRYKGGGKYSLYGKDKGRVSAAKPGGTIDKPKGLKPGAIKPKTAAKPAATQAEKAVEAAKGRLKKNAYGWTANASQNRIVDRRVASMTPQQYGASQVRSARAMVQRNRRALRDPLNAGAPASWRNRIESDLARSKKAFGAAAKDYRALKPRRR
jgi:hypothetical protein